ncbi:zinc finger protein 407-like [Oppia nitens]|uniref:zinc finger protein 407-like n=1 Tax=Oppia nitens TaxID=1686743 RepID=UPI0023D9AB81|nr:zinc finger protein 407-like [Oppia nitens]
MGDQQFHSGHPQTGHHVSAHIYALQPQCYQPSYVSQPNNETVIQLRSLQDQLNSLQQQRDQLQKELNAEKQKVLQMSQQLSAQQQLSLQMQQQYDQQLRALQFELSKYKTSPQNHDNMIHVQSGQQLTQSGKSIKVNDENVCHTCQFRSKSQVSLLLHQVNHGLTQKHLQLPTTIFTTKNNNNSFLYRCPACDGKFTRHEVYSHIYQYHTNEQPHHCTECDLFFTHYDYLTEHQRDKHNKTKKRSTAPKNDGKYSNKKNKNSPLVSSPGSSSAWNSLETIISSTIGTFDEIANIPDVNSTQQITTINRCQTTVNPVVLKPAPIAVEKSDGEYKCTFSECGFATNTKERLDFHMSAHKNSKYKCPYCPYVGNVLVDIKRHIQKSQKHQGFHVFQCQKCDYGSNCEKTFKDHLRQIHFGKEVTEKMINSFIDDMFANDTAKLLVLIVDAMGDHSHYLQPQNLMYNGYLHLSGSAQQSQQNQTIVQMRTLREQLNQTNIEKEQLQKELNLERQQKLQLQQEFQKAVQAQQELNYQCMTLRLEVAKYQQHLQNIQTSSLAQQQTQQQQCSQQVIKSEENIKQEETHICDECQFETKSQVSLFVHKMNHTLGATTPRHLHLPTRVFTTKCEGNVNFKYKCTACDDCNPFGKHEIYTHIYQFHSSEQPHKCSICLLYFTHEDYLNEHKLDKHKMAITESPAVHSGRGRGRGRGGSRGGNSSSKGAVPPMPAQSPIPKQSVIQTPYGAVKQEPTENQTNQSVINTTSTPKRKADESPDIICLTENPAKQQNTQKTTTITVAKEDDELSCTYPGCGFTAPSRDRLQFHMSAHTQSKYKCPYCAYVGNILIDIRRHILKSKKHEGLNVFQCLKCDYGSDCERTFKEHLKKSHYGLHVEESTLDSLLEELFLNENNKQRVSAE